MGSIQKEVQMKKIIILSFGLVAVVILVSLAQSYIPAPKEVTIPIRYEIERAIKVKSTDNVIEKSKSFGLGLGVGAPQIICESAEQFINLVPKEEIVFTSLKLEDNYNQTLKKVYLSFIANRAGVIIYEDEYSYSEKSLSYNVKDYNWQEVVFRTDSPGLVAPIIFSIVIILFSWIVWLIFVL